MKKLVLSLISLLMTAGAYAQTAGNRIYDENIDPDKQITDAVQKADQEGKFVICQLGGNWCKWCILFARFINSDEEIKKLVDDNYVYIHVNYNPRNGSDNEKTAKMLSRLGNPSRFGYPALVVLDGKGDVVHIQDSSFLESGEGYDKEKVVRFFKNWTPAAVNPSGK